MNNNPNPQCSFNFNTKSVVRDFSKDISKCVMAPSHFNCIVKPVSTPIVKTVLNPCFQEHIAHQGANDPYYQHMPKHDSVAAALYSAQMGGESHDITKCEIM